jgi:hypothetical protein
MLPSLVVDNGADCPLVDAILQPEFSLRDSFGPVSLPDLSYLHFGDLCESAQLSSTIPASSLLFAVDGVGLVVSEEPAVGVLAGGSVAVMQDMKATGWPDEMLISPTVSQEHLVANSELAVSGAVNACDPEQTSAVIERDFVEVSLLGSEVRPSRHDSDDIGEMT